MRIVELYTDGGASGNPGPGGYGAILKYGKYEKEFSQGYRMTTNNRMELLAVITGLEALTKEGLKVRVTSDSKYVVDAVKKGWLFNWEKKRFAKAKNSDLWKRFLKIYQKHQVEMVWVKGHDGHEMNERADRLAVEAYQESGLLVDTWYEENVLGNQGSEQQGFPY